MSTAAPASRARSSCSRRFAPRPGISHVLFDFDGTLSLIRQGWPEVMVPMFVEMLPPLPGETERRPAAAGLRRHHAAQRQADDLPDDPAGRADPRARRRAAGTALVQARVPAPAGRADRRPRRGPAQRHDRSPTTCWSTARGRCWSSLRGAGCRSTWPAAPTSRSSSRRPSCWTSTRYFGPRIYGAQDDYKNFSKKMVIDRILRENAIPGEQLLSFGDGYVEIENTKEVGGLAVAVASDEAHNGSGQMDAWKRERLLGVGADVVIPDFRDAAPLLDRSSVRSRNCP